MMRNPNSLLYWFPAVLLVDVPVPHTHWYDVPSQEWFNLLDGNVEWWQSNERNIFALARHIGFPLFMQTDILSGKHDWEGTCFVVNESRLLGNIGRLADESFAGFADEPSALVFREYVPLEAGFTAFSGLPIAKERRYFVKDNLVECHHPYWPADAIKKPSMPDWKSLLQAMNTEDEEEVKILSAMASKVGQNLRGHWSIDFAKTKEGKWLLIDMAQAERSWHPSHHKEFLQAIP